MSLILRFLQWSALYFFVFLLLSSGAHAGDCPYRGNWSGTWQETSCDNRRYTGRWVGTVDANCFFLGKDEESSSDLAHGTINPATGHVSLDGYENGCGALTGAADFAGAVMTGTFGGSGVNGSFKGQGTYTPSCNFSLFPTSASFLSEGGSASIIISAPAGCRWSVSEKVSWIALATGISGNGNGSVGYTVSRNTGSSRSATITVASHSFKVSQNAAAVAKRVSVPAVLSLLLSNNAP